MRAIKYGVCGNGYFPATVRAFENTSSQCPCGKIFAPWADKRSAPSNLSEVLLARDFRRKVFKKLYVLLQNLPDGTVDALLKMYKEKGRV